MPNPEIITTAELAQRISVPKNRLEQWRSRCIGPPYLKLGGKIVRYRMADVEAWLAANTRSPQTIRSEDAT